MSDSKNISKVLGGVAFAAVAIIVLLVVRDIRSHNRARKPGEPPRPDSSDTAKNKGQDGAGTDAGSVRESDPKDQSLAAEDPHDVFDNARRKAEVAAENAVWRLVHKEGGRAALDYIRKTVGSKPDSLQGQLEQIYLARLIPFVVTRDPAVTQDAVEFIKEVLQKETSDPWIRFQMIAGLAGLRSTQAGSISTLDGSDFGWGFNSSPPKNGGPFSPYSCSILEILKHDSAIAEILMKSATGDDSISVREIAVKAMEQAPQQEFIEILTRASVSDKDASVRSAAIRALLVHAMPNLAEHLQKIAGEDVNPRVRSVAIRSLPGACGYDPNGVAFLNTCASSEEFRRLRPDIADAMFDYLKAGTAGNLQVSLVSLLSEEPQNADLARVFAKRTLELGLTEYVPFFRALEQSLPDSEAKDHLARAIKNLEDYPRYSMLSERIKDSSERAVVLWRELNGDSATEERQREIIAELTALMEELSRLKREIAK